MKRPPKKLYWCRWEESFDTMQEEHSHGEQCSYCTTSGHCESDFKPCRVYVYERVKRQMEIVGLNTLRVLESVPSKSVARRLKIQKPKGKE